MLHLIFEKTNIDNSTIAITLTDLDLGEEYMKDLLHILADSNRNCQYEISVSITDQITTLKIKAIQPFFQKIWGFLCI